MGTNYYIYYNKKKYHIGKKSSGCNFLFDWISIIDLAHDSEIIDTYMKLGVLDER